MKKEEKRSNGNPRVKIGITFILITLGFAEVTNGQQRPVAQNNIDVQQWLEEHFSEGVVPPFSFVYDGENSNNFIKNWQFQAEKLKSDNPDIDCSVFKYSDNRSGLTVKCFVNCYKDFPAIDWVLKFSNRSGSNTPLIKDVRVIDHIFPYSQGGNFILHHAKGSNASAGDFMPLLDTLQINHEIRMMPDGGRGSSDNTAFPFFNIESPSNEGIMVAVGWTGLWYANVEKVDNRSVSLASGMVRMNLTLYPEEEIRTPKICLLFWKGEDRMVGHNQFRQFVLAHYTRKINGQFVDLPLSAGVSRGGPSPCNEFTCLNESYAIATIERFKQFDIVPEVCWIDAGWYEGGDGWWEGVGNWNIDKERFPNGLKPVSDAVHSIGAKFLLWFELERVRKHTWFEKEHPEWLLEYPATSNKDDIYNYNTYLFDLGNTEARLWLTDFVSDFLEKEGVDYYRQDFNWVDGEGSWKMKDKQGREGISEIRYIEGLYSFWDSLLVRFPELVIDNCASGGRRIDLETISRSSPLWRSDHSFGKPDGCQNHTYGLNFYFPLHGTGLFESSAYDFRSSMSSSMVLFWDIHSSESSIPQMQKCMRDFKRLRPYYYGDYYPLTGTENLIGDAIWLAYQLNRPEQKDGVILAFRRENCEEESLQVRLKGLDPQADYELIDEDSQIKEIKNGEELLKGVTLKLKDKPGSLLIWYKRIP
ncbi:alpha-galactosidase [Mariniphaga sediminis]|uniref:Alpha-galactosidase n=1 Tax=Mariniphaga sediminis TaxID=1628158 RepID=A0A399CYE6_9BACT|nr:alpha-galactosidase [Mariniphaga sediminis]RIH63978.1 alpha-galactosidase [Mariniphaga sediminis]